MILNTHMVEWLESVLSWPQYSLNSPSLDPVRDPISKNMIDGPRGPVNQGWHLVFTCMFTCMQPHMYLYPHEKYTQKEKKWMYVIYTCIIAIYLLATWHHLFDLLSSGNNISMSFIWKNILKISIAKNDTWFYLSPQ